MLGVHCGLSENIIDECSYIYFNDCIKELGIKFQYQAIVNLFGNAYAEKSSEIIQESNPFNQSIKDDKETKTHKCTLEDLKKMGVSIKVDKNAKLIGINQFPNIKNKENRTSKEN